MSRPRVSMSARTARSSSEPVRARRAVTGQGRPNSVTVPEPASSTSLPATTPGPGAASSPSSSQGAMTKSVCGS